MSDELKLTAAESALVVIDLQRGLAGRPLSPHSWDAVVANTVRLAQRFRELGSPVALVRVSFAPDGGDALKQPVDAGWSGERAADWDRYIAELGPEPADILITKRQWGAFYGTDLELQLRRRGANTIVLTGVATNFGVESTARDAYERGFALVLAEDAMSSLADESHDFAIKNIFPRLGRVRSTEQVLSAL